MMLGAIKADLMRLGISDGRPMSNRRRASEAPTSSLIRSRSVRAAFKAAETIDGGQGMADLKPHRGTFAGGPMPSILSMTYPILFMTAQRWAAATLGIEHGSRLESDRLDARFTIETFTRWGLDPRDFGFGNLTEATPRSPWRTVKKSGYEKRELGIKE